MIFLDPDLSDEHAQTICAALDGEPGAAERAQVMAEAVTAQFMADIEQARQEDVADQLARLPADLRPTAQVWLRVHGTLPPWHADQLAPRATEPGS